MKRNSFLTALKYGTNDCKLPLFSKLREIFYQCTLFFTEDFLLLAASFFASFPLITVNIKILLTWRNDGAFMPAKIWY